VALWRPQDKHKLWAQKIFREFSGPFYVTELVLSEVSHLTGRDADILAGLKTGRFIIGADVSGDLAVLEKCCSKYPHCDLADASVIAASERRPALQVLTADRRHFVTYRRSDGSALPLAMPQET